MSDPKSSGGEAPAGASTATPAAPGTVTLETPIIRGEQTITAVSVRKPQAGELRGLSLTDVLRMEISALITLLPRITTPSLTTQDVAGLDPADLVALGNEVLGFFMSKAEREAIASQFRTA